MTSALRLSAVAAWIVAALLGVKIIKDLGVRLVARSASTEAMLPLAPVRAIPYTVVFDLSPETSKKTGRNTAVIIFAVRADGSILKQMEVLDGRIPISSRLIQLASGTIITTDDVLERKSTRHLTRSVRGQLRTPESQCLVTFAGTPAISGERIVGEDVISGYKVVMAKSRIGSFWFAPTLGCAELKHRIVDSRGEVIERTASTVTPGDPAPSLFDVSRLTEVPLERLSGR
jgi:hypothetical protein